MVRTITVNNVNEALSEALWHLKTEGVVTDSRNGAVLAAPDPVITTYTQPTQRVMLSALRDANPFFHHMEAIWMLAGANDVAFPSTYAKQIAAYSDDGETLNGAYGHRWRTHFGGDQLVWLINLLRSDPHTRRAVLGMWDASSDLAKTQSSKDVPCNTHAYFSTTRGALDMTVCCRSNDAVWGAYGANAVHFSMLLQFIAEAAGLPVGHYHQLSNNLHIYLDRPDVDRLIFRSTDRIDVKYQPDTRYQYWYMQAIKPLILPAEHYTEFLRDAEEFVSDPTGDTQFRTCYFNEVVAPMQVAHMAYRERDFEAALIACVDITDTPWQTACSEWLERRRNNAK